MHARVLLSEKLVQVCHVHHHAGQPFCNWKKPEKSWPYFRTQVLFSSWNKKKQTNRTLSGISGQKSERVFAEFCLHVYSYVNEGKVVYAFPYD